MTRVLLIGLMMGDPSPASAEVLASAIGRPGTSNEPACPAEFEASPGRHP